MNHDLSQLITVKESEITNLMKEIEQVCFILLHILFQLKKDKNQFEKSVSREDSEAAKIAAGLC